MKRRFYHGLRFKLLLVSLSLLTIPWAGYRFIQEIESFLRSAQEQNLMATARTLALMVQDTSGLNVKRPSSTPNHPRPDLYVHQLPAPPVVDGFGEDWLFLSANSARYETDRFGFDILLGKNGSFLYLYVAVTDDRPRYSTDNPVRYKRSDQIELAVRNQHGVIKRYLFAPQAPGPVIGRTLQRSDTAAIVGPLDYRIRGEWQETARGYNLEFQLPAGLVGDQLGIAVLNFQQNDSKFLSTSGMGDVAGIGALVKPSGSIQQRLAGSGIADSRLWVTDRRGFVLARHGGLAESPIAGGDDIPWILEAALNLTLRHQAEHTAVLPDHRSQLATQPLLSALQGTPATHRRRPPGSDTLVLSAAHPLYSGADVVGSVMVEQTTDAILSLQNNALRRLISTSFTVLLLVSFVLLGFATVLTTRIRRLHQQMEQAVASDGRITGSLEPAGTADEIGDLGRGFAHVLNRLSEYNRYLEAMASRLSHELRTPLTIVRTSLESCDHIADPEEKDQYLRRARQGADRLDLILKQLSEATRLEKTLEQTEMRSFDLCELIKVNTDIFRSLHPDLDLQYTTSDTVLLINGSPELISQGLEKLISNAMDFRTPGTAVLINAGRQQQNAQLCVCNKGAKLPVDIDLFQSMVSVRDKVDDTPHLGLGLYLVKLIADFHGGRATADDLADGDGVSFCLSLPLEPEK